MKVYHFSDENDPTLALCGDKDPERLSFNDPIPEEDRYRGCTFCMAALVKEHNATLDDLEDRHRRLEDIARRAVPDGTIFHTGECE